MMLSQYNKALDDAKTAVGLDSNFVKGYVRIAKCCIALGETSSAKQVSRFIYSTVWKSEKFTLTSEQLCDVPLFRAAVCLQ